MALYSAESTGGGTPVLELKQYAGLVSFCTLSWAFLAIFRGIFQEDCSFDLQGLSLLEHFHHSIK